MLSLYFNDVILPNWIKVTDIKEDVVGNMEVTEKDTKFKTKVITIEYHFRRNKLIDEEKRQELLAWIVGDNFKASKLILPNRSEYFYLAKVTNLGDITGSIRKGKGSIEFTCFDSHSYSCNEIKLSITNNSLFRTFYTGSVKVYPTIRFKINSQTSKIKLNFGNSKFEGFIELNGHFNSGQVIELDQSHNKVTVDGNKNMHILHLKSKRSMLVNGINEYKLNSGNCTVEIIYREKYR